MANFRKTKDGKWVVFALEAETRRNPVAVTLKSGETKMVEIERWSRPFDTDNGPACYGTPKPDAPKRVEPVEEEDPF